MTAQHAPHTPPLWRKFLSLPHTRLGWLAVGLSGVGGALLLLLIRSFAGNDVSLWVVRPVIVGLLAGAVVGLIALLRSQEERSILVWLAMVPMVLLLGVASAFVVQWLGYILIHGLSILSPVPLQVATVVFLVGMMALIAALHFLQRHSERYGLGGTISSVASFISVALILVGALIGAVSQNWALGGPVMGAGLWAASVVLAALAIITLYAGVVPWWGGVALIAANPLLNIILLFTLSEGWKLWLGLVPWVVVGFAVFLAARRRNERPARVR